MSNKISTKKLLKILELTPAEQNIMLYGKHGIGKSQILTEYYSKKGMKVVTLFLGQMSDPGDLIGLPKFNEETGLTEFMPPFWFPIDGKPIVLFLDELNRARPELLQVIMDLALNRKLAGKPLPAGSRIISAVNYGDEYEVNDLDPALVSRFNIYEFAPNANEWISWAEKNGIDSRIIYYIKSNPSMLDCYEIKNDSNNLMKFPDRRGWEKVSNIIKNEKTLDEVYFSLISGIIGNEVAADFITCSKSSFAVSGSDIIYTGKSMFPKILEVTTITATEVINQVISVLAQLNTETEIKKTFCAKNFVEFIKFLYDNKHYEILAYFISTYVSKSNIEIKEFIHKYCNEALVVISKFVSEYNMEM